MGDALVASNGHNVLLSQLAMVSVLRSFVIAVDVVDVVVDALALVVVVVVVVVAGKREVALDLR